MDALTRNIYKLIDNGFSSNSNVSFQSLSGGEPWSKLGQEMHPSKLFYAHTVKSNMGDETVFQQAYTVGGDYIGSIEDAVHLCEKLGISPEKAAPTHGVCSVGQAENGDWFGWSHRAISSFPSREEAVEFAESVSTSTIGEAQDHIENNLVDTELHSIARNLFADIFESKSARNVNVVQCVWYRYGDTRRIGLKTKDGDKFMVEKGDIFGIRYDQRNDQLNVYSNEELDLPFLADAKIIAKLVSASKPYRGKVDGKVIPKQSDWLIPAQRKAFDRKHLVAPKAKAPVKKAPVKKAPSAAAIKPPTSPDVKVVPEQKFMVKAKPAKMKDYNWFKVAGKVPVMKCMDDGDRVDVELESGDIFGIRFVPDTNEIVAVFEEENNLQFPLTLLNLRKMLKSAATWSGQVKGLNGRASRAEGNAAAKYWTSAEFTKLFNAGVRDQKAAVRVKAEREFIDSVDVDEGGRALTAKQNKDIERVLNAGETIWFAAAVTNTARSKANVVFDVDKKKCLARIKPLMKGNAADTITTGVVSKAHGIYREYLESGERKAGLTIHAGRVQPLIRDALEDTVSSNKSGNIVSQEVTVPEFNENISKERIDKAPVFKGNDVEVLMQISNLITSRKAFTGAYQPLPKLKKIRAGECLLLKAKHNNERYRVEGTQVVNRLRRFYGSKSITGAFKENDGNLFLILYMAAVKAKAHNGKMISQTEEVRSNALAIRQFMTNTSPEKLERAQDEARRNQLRTSQIKHEQARLLELNSAIDTIENALTKRRAKLNQAKLQGGDLIQHETKIAEYEDSLRPLLGQRKRLSASIQQAVEKQAELINTKGESRSVKDSVYMTEDGEQVVIVAPNYPAGELIVSPIKGSKANYDRQIAVTKLFDLGGVQLL